MDRIDENKRVDEDQQQGKGRLKWFPKTEGIIDQRGRTGSYPSRPHDDALVVTLRIEGYDVKRVLIDQGSGVEIMYPNLYKGLKLRPKDLACYDSPLMGFDGKTVIAKGQIRLPVQARSKVVEVDFIVVNAYSPYIAIMVRPWLHTIGVVSSTSYLKVKYPSGNQVEELIKSQSMARQYVVVEGAKCKKLEKIVIDEDEEKFFQVGVQLPPREKEELVAILMKNVDVFAWSAYEALGVDPNFIYHHLNDSPSITPKKQPPRRSSKEYSDAVKEEMIKLKQAGAIKEVFYPKWLANTMVVKKKNEKWRVCVDFTNLNKDCPKDHFPISQIDQLVDATVDHSQMSFLDVFQGYYQILLALDDQEKTAFVTPTGNYNCKMMPFGLKNARSTYQRMMTRMFEPQLGKNIEVYIDDMVVKIKVESEHVKDLGSIFEVLRKHKLCLNASKYSFGVSSGKFPGFEWTKEYALAFQQLKDYLSRPPIMSKLKEEEVIFAYIAVAFHVVSLVDYTGRVAKWRTILGAFDIKYMPRTSIKGQVLVDLVAEFTESPSEMEDEEQNLGGKPVGTISLQGPLSWKLYVDGAANLRGSGIGLVVISPNEITIEKSLRLSFSVTNNEVEYETLLVGMAMVQKIGGEAVDVFSDSRLVVGQVKGKLEAWDSRMQEYLNKARRLQSSFEFFTLQQIPRSINTHADSLATLATSSGQGLP
ncbi:uncharacterized protein LOC142620209 [Castanea sativa]|uniref:uncharacterized protein LOC142620209 n=1 Tax=Castanea sativa TaxID=21020 RepID=UPI003F651DE5